MLKNFLVVTTAALAIAATASLPASATGQTCVLDEFGQCEPVQSVPEPSSILGTITVAGTLIGMKVLSAKKNAKKQ